MFAKLRQYLGGRRARSGPPHIPPGQRVYAIGDIHGELALAQRLVALIERDNAARGPAEVHLVFLGDYVDRGAHSAALIDWLIEQPPAFARNHFLRGNHEDAFHAVLEGDESDLAGWRRFGGRETLASYQIGDREVAMGGPFFRAALAEKVPATHRAFLAGLRDYVQIGDYLFVHAGIRPGVAIDAQDPRDLTWIRREFLESERDHGVIVVHGHTISPDVVERPNRIGIDTGAYMHGRLTAVGLEGEERWFLAAERESAA